MMTITWAPRRRTVSMNAINVATILLLLTLHSKLSRQHEVMAFEQISTQSTKKSSASRRVAPREYAVLSDPSTETYFSASSRHSQDSPFASFDRQSRLQSSKTVANQASRTTTATTTPNRIQFPLVQNNEVDHKTQSKSLLQREIVIQEVVITKKQISVHRCSKGLHLPYESALDALRIYHSHHANLVLPQKFIVPEQGGYPIAWHGLDLAGTVYNMEWWQTHVKQRPNRVTELNELGFIWERLQPQWNLVLTALITYSSHYGHVKVPAKFVVPHGDKQWPKATWGIPLGNCVYRIRSRHDFLRGSNASSRRAQLDGLGFVWEVGDQRFRLFYRALKHYMALQSGVIGTAAASARSTMMLAAAGAKIRPRQAIRVPSTFVIPSNDMAWPEDLWNYPLGAKCAAVRQKELYVKNNPERMQALIELGFHSSGNAHLGWLDVVHAAAIYSRLNRNKLNVPFNFVVPAPRDDHLCPATASMADCEDWAWPERLWGLPLGQRLKDIRVKGAYLKGQTGTARRAQLDALGFEWTPKRGPRRR